MTQQPLELKREGGQASLLKVKSSTVNRKEITAARQKQEIRSRQIKGRGGQEPNKRGNAFEDSSLGDESKACSMQVDILLNAVASSLILEAVFKSSLCRTGTEYF